MHIEKEGESMKSRKVTILWQDGRMTYMQSINALRIACKWLRTRSDVLMVHVSNFNGSASIFLPESR